MTDGEGNVSYTITKGMVCKDGAWLVTSDWDCDDAFTINNPAKIAAELECEVIDPR